MFEGARQPQWVRMGSVLLSLIDKENSAGAEKIVMSAEVHFTNSRGAAVQWNKSALQVMLSGLGLLGVVVLFARDGSNRNPYSRRAVTTDAVATIDAAVTALAATDEMPLIATEIEEPETAPSVRGVDDVSVPTFRVKNSGSSIRHVAPLHEQMVTPGNFEYLGAFRPPHTDDAKTRFSYGGWAMAFHEQGDAGGDADGYSGSLFLTGHRQEDLVAEISIPQPVISRSMDELPVASVLQPLSDITAGIREHMTQGSSEPFQIGGLCVVGDRMHWTLYKYYNVQTVDYPSHGVSSLTLSDPRPEGLWHLGPSNTGRSEWHSYKHAGYIFEIPPDQAKQWWFGGRSLISGLQIATGLNIASHGPAMFAYNLPEGSVSKNHDLDALPLVYNDIERPAPDFIPSDRWTGGAWLTLNDKQTVIIAGRKSLGESYYGEARPHDCTSDKGFHGAPYEAQIRFYAPQVLAATAAGETEPTTVKPWDVWDHDSPGGGFNKYLFHTCTQMLGGLAYDRKNNLLYVAQIDAGTTADQPYELLPAIHVFRIVP